MSGQAIRRPAYRRRVVERHPVAGPGAPIVAGHHEALEAELLHDLDLVLGHPAKGIVAVIRQPARLATVAVAAQVGDDDGEVLGQPRVDESPVDVRQRVAVQQQQRGSGAADDAVDRDSRIAGGQIEAPEALVHACSLVRGQARDRHHEVQIATELVDPPHVAGDEGRPLGVGEIDVGQRGGGVLDEARAIRLVLLQPVEQAVDGVAAHDRLHSRAAMLIRGSSPK